ncbi:MAG: fibronectin-binding domain-containing protein [Methanobacteriota archaeon]|nr:MAG: fibronectin-binding domain-containing protein [Euryarchaeota archaeon]
MKSEMSSFDLMAVVGELKTMDLRIKKIFQPSPTELRIQVRLREGGTKNLLAEIGRALYLSDHALPSPRFPSNFAMTLRKHLSNAVVKEIRQAGFDRIVELVAGTREGDFRLVFELFGEGNVVLTDEEGVIKAVMRPKRFKHRELIGRERYRPPPQRQNPFDTAPQALAETVEGYGSLVKALASPLGLGGLYAEEVCLRAGIQKDASKISPEEAERIEAVLKELKEEALHPAPVIVYEGEQPIDVTPTRLKVYEGRRTKAFQSFNEALDEFFTKEVVDKAAEEAEARYREVLVSLNMRLREQAKAIARFNREIKRGRLIGDIIYRNFERLQSIMDIVSKARKTHSAKEIDEKIKGVEGVTGYLPRENALLVRLEGVEFKLDLSIPASKNADHYYSRSKKAREKLKGARAAAEKTRARIAEHVERGAEDFQMAERAPVRKKTRQKRWYERFRWFISSEGFLVVAGRDASSNEVVVKRHMEKKDLFVHADIHGAPAVIIKSGGRDIPEKTIEEACQFAASNSTAWKSNAAFLDVYWVRPEQVSKTPESGEYVAKGAFIIRGKRNYRRSKLELALGVRLDEEPPVMAGPPSAIARHCNYHVIIRPGDMKSKEAALKIKELIHSKAAEEHKKAVGKINIDEIQKSLPTGGYTIGEER